MSYDISLNDPVTYETINLGFKHDMRGGTYVLGGNDLAELNITYNYSEIFERVLSGAVEEMDKFSRVFGGKKDGIRMIYGMTGAESIPLLEAAIEKLGDDVDKDYWKATEGNAKRALSQLLALARLRPDGVWEGD